jgi:transposase
LPTLIKSLGYQNISAALKVAKNTVATIILKWKKFGTTKNLPRAGRRAKVSNLGRRVLVREITKNPMVTDRAPEFLCIYYGSPLAAAKAAASLPGALQN